MPNTLSKLIDALFKDPAEQVGIALPSAALVAVFFHYRQQIYPPLQYLPDPFSASSAGALIFVVLTLAVSLVVKRLSHDLLNSAYDHFYRDRKRLKADSWYQRAQHLALSTNDPLLSKYHEALARLRDNNNPVVARVDALQTQSKLARSMTLILFIFTLVLLSKKLFILASICAAVSAVMLSSFFNERWTASELVYQALYKTYHRQERRYSNWVARFSRPDVPSIVSRDTESMS